MAKQQPLVNVALVGKNAEVNELVVMNYQVRGIKLFHIDGGYPVELLPERTYILAENNTRYSLPDHTEVKLEKHPVMNCIVTTTDGIVQLKIQPGNQLIIREYDLVGYKLRAIHGALMFLPI